MELPSSRRLVRPILPTSLRMSVLSRASRSPMRYWAIVGTSGGKACNCYWLLDDSAEWSTAKKITLPARPDSSDLSFTGEAVQSPTGPRQRLQRQAVRSRT